MSAKADHEPAVVPEWVGSPERGSVRLLRLMAWLSLRLGRRWSRVVLYPVALYFLLLAPTSRAASRAYLRRVLLREPGWRDLYRHFLSFATTVHDRVYLLNGRFDLFDIAVYGSEPVHELVRAGQGAFLLGAHLGSFEIIRAVGRERALPVAMVMYEENARRINAALAAINPAVRPDIVPLGRVDSMLLVRDRLDQGTVLGILADRTVQSEAGAPMDFLGAPADFPLGPFRLAAMLRRPVIFMAGLYLGGNRYAIYFEPLADFSDVTREQRGREMELAMGRYVACLERYCRMAPYNWFNFFSFWQRADTGAEHS